MTSTTGLTKRPGLLLSSLRDVGVLIDGQAEVVAHVHRAGHLLQSDLHLLGNLSQYLHLIADDFELHQIARFGFASFGSQDNRPARKMLVHDRGDLVAQRIDVIVGREFTLVARLEDAESIIKAQGLPVSANNSHCRVAPSAATSVTHTHGRDGEPL